MRHVDVGISRCGPDLLESRVRDWRVLKSQLSQLGELPEHGSSAPSPLSDASPVPSSEGSGMISSKGRLPKPSPDKEPGGVFVWRTNPVGRHDGWTGQFSYCPGREKAASRKKARGGSAEADREAASQ